MVEPAAFPPNFAGNPWTYGLALFSLTLVSSISLFQLLGYVFEARRKKQVCDRIGAMPLPEPPVPQSLTHLGAFRQIVCGFLVMTFIGSTPDVLILLAWGETTQKTMEDLYLLDRIGDGLVMIPFLFSLWTLARVRQSLPQQLAKVLYVPVGPIHWEVLKPHIRILVPTILIAIGVTWGKAWGT